MTRGGHLTKTGWPRLAAHFAILLALVALWLPHGRATAVAAAPREVPVAAEAPTAAPLEQMATRPRLTTSLPDAGSAFFITPSAPPVTTAKAAANTRNAKTTKDPRSARKVNVIAPAPAKLSALSPRAGWGNDISWPQCDGATVPGRHDIGVVGLTGGRPFTTNPCLRSEFDWAKKSQMAGGAQLYINLEIGGFSDGPRQCNPDDHGCRAYNYGWMTVVDSMARASGQGVSTTFWWLDVEIGNNWSDNLDLNSSTVQGAIDAVHSRNLDVGIYSSADQWALIVPPTYKPGVPTWLAVVGDTEMAPHLCSPAYSLTGGPVYLVQFDDHTFDSDHVCVSGNVGFAMAAQRQGH